MKFIKTELEGVIICEPQIFADERGYFCETFRLDLLEDFCQQKFDFVQDNESLSSVGVLRGLHFQLPPHAQIGINWGDFYDLDKLILSQKDLIQPKLSEAKELF